MFRKKLDSARESLMEVREHLTFLGIDVVLREPNDEEMEEARCWLVPQ